MDLWTAKPLAGNGWNGWNGKDEVAAGSGHIARIDQAQRQPLVDATGGQPQSTPEDSCQATDLVADANRTGE